MNNPYLNYQSQSIQTMTQGEMIQALFEGLLKQCTIAIMHIENRDTSQAHTAIVKAQDIVMYLASTLNPKVALSDNLFSLYDYFGSQLVEANIKKETSYIQVILPLIEDLKATFHQADKLNRQNSVK